MLVLRRKVGERVTIQKITVTILAVEGERVKLGFEAPPDVPIVRTELLQRDDGDQPPSQPSRPR